MWSDQRGQTRNLLLAFQAALNRKRKRIKAQSTCSTQYGTVIPVLFFKALCSNETTSMERGIHWVGHVDAVSQSGGEGPVPDRDQGGHRGPTATLPVRMLFLPLLRCSNGLRWACSGVSKVNPHTSNGLQLLNRSKMRPLYISVAYNSLTKHAQRKLCTKVVANRSRGVKCNNAIDSVIRCS